MRGPLPRLREGANGVVAAAPGPAAAVAPRGASAVALTFAVVASLAGAAISYFGMAAIDLVRGRERPAVEVILEQQDEDDAPAVETVSR